MTLLKNITNKLYANTDIPTIRFWGGYDDYVFTVCGSTVDRPWPRGGVSPSFTTGGRPTCIRDSFWRSNSSRCCRRLSSISCCSARCVPEFSPVCINSHVSVGLPTGQGKLRIAPSLFCADNNLPGSTTRLDCTLPKISHHGTSTVTVFQFSTQE